MMGAYTSKLIKLVIEVKTKMMVCDRCDHAFMGTTQQKWANYHLNKRMESLCRSGLKRQNRKERNGTICQTQTHKQKKRR